MSQYFSNPIPHRKWLLDDAQAMHDCAEDLVAAGFFNVTYQVTPNPQPESIPMRGEIIRHLSITLDDRTQTWDVYQGQVVVLIDVVNVLQTMTPDEYNAKFSGAQ